MPSNKYYVEKLLELSEEDVAKLPYSKKMLYIQRIRKLLDQIQKNKLETYNADPKKIHLKQVEFHKSMKRKRGLLGGNRTGKTVAGAVECVWWARGNHPYRNIGKRTNGWVVSLTNEVQRDVAQKEVLKWINPDWIVGIGVRDGSKSDINNAILDYIDITSIHGGVSRIGFKTVEQGRERFQGTSKDYIWFDEEPPKDIYDECLMRIMDVEGSIWLTMTPLKGITFIYDVIYVNENNDEEVMCLQMSWDDNPWLTKKEIAYMEKNLTPDELEARRDGRFVALTGLVYKMYNPDLHELDAEYCPQDHCLYLVDKNGERYGKIFKEWYKDISIDPGYRNPTAINFYAVDDEGTQYCLAGSYESEKLPVHHSETIRRIGRDLGWPKTNGKYSAIIDAAACAKNAANEKSVRQLYQEAGVNTRITTKDVWAGIQRCMRYLAPIPYFDSINWPKGKPRFFVLKVKNWPYDPSDFRREIKKYRWKHTAGEENDTEGPRKKDDHAMDNWSYFTSTLPEGMENLNHADARALSSHGFLSPEERADIMRENNFNTYTGVCRPGRKKA